MAESPVVPDRAEFERLVRDALANLYDHAALQTQPLASFVSRGGAEPRSRAEQLRDSLVGAIERLRPPGQELSAGSTEWRPYLLLRGRYLEGQSLPDLQTGLALSERQLRREHRRAVDAVAGLLWDDLFPGRPATAAGGPVGAVEAAPSDEQANGTAFVVTPMPLDILEVIRGVMSTLERRAENEGAVLQLSAAGALPRVLADRVILRQILLSLMGYTIDVLGDGPITITLDTQANNITIHIRFHPDDSLTLPAAGEDGVLHTTHYWAQRLRAGLEWGEDPAKPDVAQLILTLPRAGQPVLLVVDDQEMAHRMYRRYLSQANVRVVGVRDGAQALDLARNLQPAAITLDAMMPDVDGWEILQALQADPTTCHIPVIVCSVWEEPELAFSLGATGFVKKPVTQNEFLAALRPFHLLET